MKKRIIISSIVTIALCLALISGSTFALFTSENDFDIAVTAGKVKISAFIDSTKTYTQFNSYTGTDTFENGGTAKLVNGVLTLDRMAPGDAVTATIDVKNNGTDATNIDFAYKVVLKMSGELAEALTATARMDGATADIALTYDAAADEYVSDWVFVDVTDATQNYMSNIDVTVAFPNSMDHAAQNWFQGKTADINFNIVAVQANGTAIYDGQ